MDQALRSVLGIRECLYAKVEGFPFQGQVELSRQEGSLGAVPLLGVLELVPGDVVRVEPTREGPRVARRVLRSPRNLELRRLLGLLPLDPSGLRG
jgi:hypothetical protein